MTSTCLPLFRYFFKKLQDLQEILNSSQETRITFIKDSSSQDFLLTWWNPKSHRHLRPDPFLHVALEPFRERFDVHLVLEIGGRYVDLVGRRVQRVGRVLFFARRKRRTSRNFGLDSVELRTCRNAGCAPFLFWPLFVVETNFLFCSFLFFVVLCVFFLEW